MASLQANTTKRINEVWKMNLSSLFVKEKINNLHFFYTMTLHGEKELNWLLISSWELEPLVHVWLV